MADAPTSTPRPRVDAYREVARPGEVEITRVIETWRSGHIEDAHHIFVPELSEKASRLDRERPVLTCCGSGFRARIAASVLAAKGCSQVYYLPGGMAAWNAADYPLIEEP